MNAQSLFESGDQWHDEAVRLGLPIVLSRAMGGVHITYGGLSEITGGTPIGQSKVAMKIGDICKLLRQELDPRVPPLNAIIVNQASELPSHGVEGYLADWYRMSTTKIASFSAAELNAFKRQSMLDVFTFSHWPLVARYLGLKAKLATPAKSEMKKPKLPDPSGFAQGPESQAHKNLKAWAAANPGFFAAYGRFKKGKPEAVLSSGDRVDVLFEHGGESLAVEVKTSAASIDELKRGVFQCVKYRATIRAMQLTNDLAPNGAAVLLLDRRAPASVTQLADRHAVDILVTVLA